MKRKVLGLITDGASYMDAAKEKLKAEHGYVNMIPVTCIAHGLHNIANEVRQSPQYNMLYEIMMAVKKFFQNSPKRKNLFHQLNPNSSMPPDFVSTRWGLWIIAVEWYTSVANLKAIEETLMKVPEAAMHNQFDFVDLHKNEEFLRQANEVHSNFGFLKETFKKLQGHYDAVYKITAFKAAIDAIRPLNVEMKKTHKRQIERNFSDYVWGKWELNVGLQTLYKYLFKGNPTKEILNMNDQEKAALKNLETTSTDSERGFSIYGAFYTDRRHKFQFETIQCLMISKCIFNKVSILS